MTGPRIIGGKLTEPAYTQEQWDRVFDFCFSMLLSLGYGVMCWLFDVPWWLTSIIIGSQVHSWAARKQSK